MLAYKNSKHILNVCCICYIIIISEYMCICKIIFELFESRFLIHKGLFSENITKFRMFNKQSFEILKLRRNLSKVK